MKVSGKKISYMGKANLFWLMGVIISEILKQICLRVKVIRNGLMAQVIVVTINKARSTGMGYINLQMVNNIMVNGKMIINMAMESFLTNKVFQEKEYGKEAKELAE